MGHHIYMLVYMCMGSALGDLRSSPKRVQGFSLVCLLEDVELRFDTSQQVSIVLGPPRLLWNGCALHGKAWTATSAREALPRLLHRARGQRQAAKGLKVNPGSRAPWWNTNYRAAHQCRVTPSEIGRAGQVITTHGTKKISEGAHVKCLRSGVTQSPSNALGPRTPGRACSRRFPNRTTAHFGSWYRCLWVAGCLERWAWLGSCCRYIIC